MYPSKAGRCLVLTATISAALYSAAATGMTAPISAARDAQYTPAVLPVTTSALVRSNNAFALDVYSQLERQDRNLFFSPYSLAGPLRRLGLVTAFESARADFSGLSATPGFCISDIVHKARIEVDEKGTVAAAATAETGTLGAVYRPDNPPEFDVDHPFLFLIHDDTDGGILFLGRVLDPR